MHQFASAGFFARYDQYLNQRPLAELPEYQQCADPSSNDGGFVDENDSFITCTTCSTVKYISCRTRYHPGIIPAENKEAITQEQSNSRCDKEKHREERKSTKAIKKLGAKPCPSESCGILVHKVSGRDHIICKSHSVL
jgi:hypothetical protein